MNSTVEKNKLQNSGKVSNEASVLGRIKYGNLYFYLIKHDLYQIGIQAAR